MDVALPAMLPALPEMFLAVAGMGLLVYGVFTHSGGAQPLTSWGTVVAFVVAAGLAIVSYLLFFSWAGGGGYERREPARARNGCAATEVGRARTMSSRSRLCRRGNRTGAGDGPCTSQLRAILVGRPLCDHPVRPVAVALPRPGRGLGRAHGVHGSVYETFFGWNKNVMKQINKIKI